MTLGDKLDPTPELLPKVQSDAARKRKLFWFFNVLLVLILGGTILAWTWIGAQADTILMLEILLALGVVWAVVLGWGSSARRKVDLRRTHFLLEHDKQGFMRHLRVDAKTAVLDGSNVYHFGHANDLDAQPLGLIAEQLRREGYRVVCFFDANIFYTLQEHGAFTKTERHELALLMDIFGLSAHEIYVVPSGVQADRFILNTLRHMPISFAVTNDQFRDYAKEYSEVMKGDQWRKGILISKNEIKMHKHKFKKPVYVT